MGACRRLAETGPAHRGAAFLLRAKWDSCFCLPAPRGPKEATDHAPILLGSIESDGARSSVRHLADVVSARAIPADKEVGPAVVADAAANLLRPAPDHLGVVRH